MASMVPGPLVASIVCSALMFVAYFMSPQGIEAVRVNLASRGIATILLWMIFMLRSSHQKATR